jgi:hypothetical protein
MSKAFIPHSSPPAFRLLSSYSWSDILSYCAATWQTVPDPLAIPRQYNITAASASRIIFSNGLIDPWWPGGILKE